MKLDLTVIQTALGKGTCRLSALPPSAQAYLGCALPMPQVWVTDGVQSLEQLADCFRTLLPEKTTLLTLPPAEKDDMEVLSECLNTLRFLKMPTNPFVLITVKACLEETLPAVESREVRMGESTDPDIFCDWLSDAGYSFDVEVYEKGCGARRGGILDIWPPTAPLPVRLEFFGNEIESIRTFDPAGQCSVEKIDSVELFPLNTSGSLKLSKLLLENTHWIFSNVDAITTGPSIHIGCLTSDVMDIDLASYETNLKPVSELHRPDAAEQQRSLFFKTLEKMVTEGWTVHIYMETTGAAERLSEVYLSNVKGQKSTVRVRIGLLHGSFVCKEQKYLVITEADIYGYQPKVSRARRKSEAAQAGGPRIAEWRDIQPGELVVHVDHGIGKYLGLMEVEVAGRRQEMLLLEYADTAKIYLPTAQAHLLTRYVGLGRAAPGLHHLKGRRWQNERVSAETAIADLAASLLETQAARALKRGRACEPDTHWQNEFENAFPYAETPDQIEAIREVKADLEAAQPMDRLICGDAGYGKTEVAMRAAFKMVMEGRQVAMLVPTTVLAQQHFDTFTERMAAFPICIEMLSRFRTHAEQNDVIKRLAEGEVDIVIGTHRLVSDDVRFKDLGLVVIDEEQRFGVRAKEHLKQLRKQIDVLTMTATPIPRTLYMGLTGARDMSTIQTPPQERQPVETIVLDYHEDIVREAILHELARDGQIFYLHNRVQTIAKVKEKLDALVPEARVEYAHGQMSERQLSDVMHRFMRGEFDVLLCTTIIESGVDIPRVNTIIIDRADRFGLSELYQLRGRVGRARHKAYAFLLLPRHGQLFDTARQRIQALKCYSGHSTGFRIAMRDLEIRGAGNLLGAQQSGHIAAIGFDLYCQLLKRAVAQLKGEKVPPIIDVVLTLDFLDRSPTKSSAENGAFIPYDYMEDENLRVKLYGQLAALATENEVREMKKEFTDRFGPLPKPLKTLFEIARLRIAAARKNIQSIQTRDGRVIITQNGKAFMDNGRYPRLSGGTVSQKLRAIRTLL